MTDDLALPNFKRYRYHLLRLWPIPVVFALVFAVAAAGTSTKGAGAARATAILVPTEFAKEGDDVLFLPITRFESSLAVLRSSSTRDAIETELDFTPTVHVDAKPDGVTIAAIAPSAEQAERARDAYVASFVEAREKVIASSIARAVEDLTQRAETLERSIESIDAQLEQAPAGNAAVLANSDRAQTRALLLETRGDIAALQAMRPSDRVDVRVEALGIRERDAGSGDLVRTLAGLITGSFLGTLMVLARAYLDERVRTPTDLATLDLPSFRVINAASPDPDPGVLELTASISQASSVDPLGYELGLLALEEADGDRVLELVRRAAVLLDVELPKICTATKPAERIRLAHRSAGVVLLVTPGGVRHDDLLHEVKMVNQAGAKLLGISIVARDVRSARRSG